MTRSPTIRLMLCRPQGGLNDIFCQIVKTCEYGRKFGRKVFIDTAYVKSFSFWDVFTRYFVGRASFQIHKFLQVQDEIVDTLMQRLAAIGQPYHAIHIRHSDIQTDYMQASAILETHWVHPHGDYSGFSLLAKAFDEDRKALQSFVMRPNLPY